MNFDKAIYNYEWYNLSPTEAKFFLICMIRTQKPQCLTSGKFTILSLTIFTDVSIHPVIFSILQLCPLLEQYNCYFIIILISFPIFTDSQNFDGIFVEDLSKLIIIFCINKINIEYKRSLSDIPKFSFFKRYEELFSIL
ncbi:odorant receptor 4-like [Vespula maculifrons]|uniref:Odorant receptor 4-like n=1 Tax=Vespula maculifrons TaxID=7453 RepID=A0ABD2BR03_VESMC